MEYIDTASLLEVIDDAELPREAAWVRARIVEDAVTIRALRGASINERAES